MSTPDAVRILIHAIPQRMWYVEGFLIPDLVRQGIERENVGVFCDTETLGNLESCVCAFEEAGKTPGGTWHLQDDILPARDFADQARQYAGDEIACGFCVERFDLAHGKTGRVPQCFLWLSFPCIYIPNETAAEFARWYRTSQDPEIRRLRSLRRGDDSLFWYWHHNHRAFAWGWNAEPNLVEHVDWLIGGSAANKERSEASPRAKYWTDDELVEDLKNRINAQG